MKNLHLNAALAVCLFSSTTFGVPVLPPPPQVNTSSPATRTGPGFEPAQEYPDASIPSLSRRSNSNGEPFPIPFFNSPAGTIDDETPAAAEPEPKKSLGKRLMSVFKRSGKDSAATAGPSTPSSAPSDTNKRKTYRRDVLHHNHPFTRFDHSAFNRWNANPGPSSGEQETGVPNAFSGWTTGTLPKKSRGGNARS